MCAGTPLYLKNMLGKGYRINMVCEKENVQKVKKLMKIVVPGSIF